jgi:uncharacterized protein YodC (DUF2158 family)
MTQGHRSGKPENTTQLPTHLSHGKKTCRWYHLEGHAGTRTSQGATPQQPIQLQELGERKGNCSHMPPRTSMANITAHALPSGDGEKMKIGHPTNDPRPSFRQTENTTRLPTHLSHGKKTCRWYHLEGHAGDQDEQGSHTTTAHTAPRTWRAEGELFTYASQDEHGQHYRSCATEWGWREDENRPPYK